MVRLAILSTCALALSASAALGGNGFFRNGAVGGVAIDVNGVLSEPTAKATKHLAAMMKQQVQPAQGAMNEGSELRRISLKRLAFAVAQADRKQKDLPAEYRYLAGIQRVQYVFVYPEENDIVLAGPGEGWKVTETGEVVGRTTGQPVLQLDDLLIALRTSEQARQVGVSCSIDPQEIGIKRMNALMRKQRSFNRAVLTKIEKAMGPQQITLQGVPENSHFARVLVAADYRMKRIAMDLEKSPMKGLPSYLDMWARSRARLTSKMPRWWLACDYEPLARTDDGLGWELRGPGVKVMTEDEFVDADGKRTRSGRSGDLAKKWADTMTAQYEDLAAKSPIFGQLRNLMDLSVIAAVIDKHDLVKTAGCDLSPLLGSDVVTDAWNVPKTVSTQSSFTKRGSDYLITASGGVQIESWQVAEKSQVDSRVKAVYAKAGKLGGSWWK